MWPIIDEGREELQKKAGITGSLTCSRLMCLGGALAFCSCLLLLHLNCSPFMPVRIIGRQ